MATPDDRRYTDQHEWALVQGTDGTATVVRVGVSTAVTGNPGGLMIDGRPITTPYEFVVIGSPQNMETAMNIPGGVVPRFTSRGASVDIKQSDKVVVDALRPLDTPQYAAPDTGN